MDKLLISSEARNKVLAKGKVLIICGPTATGKTSLGIRLAKKFDGEIISADSCQVYRGMDIGTGKDLPKSSKFKAFDPSSGRGFQSSKLQFKVKSFQIGYYLINGVKVWLLDVVEPDYRFSVADYIRCVQIVIRDVWRRGKLPIIVGGTGFYIKGLIEGIETIGVKPDWELRRQLSNKTVKQLNKRLKKLDPQKHGAMNESDRKNPRRLIRAIEIAWCRPTSEVSPPPKLLLRRRNVGGGPSISEVKVKNVLFIGLTATYKVLYQRIDKRVEERARQGIEAEIKKLLDKGYLWESSALGATLGYREWWPFFDKKAPKKEVIQRWKFNEHAYARRQLTWFKREKRICWFDITLKRWQDKVESLVEKWYSNNNGRKS